MCSAQIDFRMFLIHFWNLMLNWKNTETLQYKSYNYEEGFEMVFLQSSHSITGMIMIQIIQARSRKY